MGVGGTRSGHYNRIIINIQTKQSKSLRILTLCRLTLHHNVLDFWRGARRLIYTRLLMECRRGVARHGGSSLTRLLLLLVLGDLYIQAALQGELLRTVLFSVHNGQGLVLAQQLELLDLGLASMDVVFDRQRLAPARELIAGVVGVWVFAGCFIGHVAIVHLLRGAEVACV